MYRIESLEKDELFEGNAAERDEAVAVHARAENVGAEGHCVDSDRFLSVHERAYLSSEKIKNLQADVAGRRK